MVATLPILFQTFLEFHQIQSKIEIAQHQLEEKLNVKLRKNI